MSTINDTATAGHLQLCDVTKVFANRGKDVTAVDRISLDIAPGEFITLLGPSGCGKTTTLRMVAGFEDTTSGRVVLDGEDMVTLPPNKRPMSMVFQSYALFPHLSVRDNVSYGLKLRHLSADELRERVDVALASMNLTVLADRAPNELSGGQQQRVFLAMTLAQDTPYLLLDEPTTYLDLNHQVTLMSLMRTRQQQGRTVITVLHDLNQAARYCDYLVVLKAGELIAAGEPEQVLTPALLAEVFAVAAQPFSCPYSHRPMCIIENALEARPG